MPQPFKKKTNKAPCPKVQFQGRPSNFKLYIEQQILNNNLLP